MFLWIEIIICLCHKQCGEKLFTILAYMPDTKYDFKIIKLLRVQLCVYTYEGKNDLNEN